MSLGCATCLPMCRRDERALNMSGGRGLYRDPCLLLLDSFSPWDSKMKMRGKEHKRLSAASPQPKLFGRDTPLLPEEGWLRHKEDVAKPPKRRRRRAEPAQAR